MKNQHVTAISFAWLSAQQVGIRDLWHGLPAASVPFRSTARARQLRFEASNPARPGGLCGHWLHQLGATWRGPCDLPVSWCVGSSRAQGPKEDGKKVPHCISWNVGGCCSHVIHMSWHVGMIWHVLCPILVHLVDFLIALPGHRDEMNHG